MNARPRHPLSFCLCLSFAARARCVGGWNVVGLQVQDNWSSRMLDFRLARDTHGQSNVAHSRYNKRQGKGRKGREKTGNCTRKQQVL
jgi:hypothetical protein